MPESAIKFGAYEVSYFFNLGDLLELLTSAVFKTCICSSRRTQRPETYKTSLAVFIWWAWWHGGPVLCLPGRYIEIVSETKPFNCTHSNDSQPNAM